MSKNAFIEVPYHIGYLTMDEDDSRRHKSRCIYLVDKYDCKKYESCIGSSHCHYYKEKEINKEINDELIQSDIPKQEMDKNLYNATVGKMFEKYRENKLKKEKTEKKENQNKQIDFIDDEYRKTVEVGSLVEVKYVEDDLVDLYKIVLENEDILNNKINANSPIAKELLGREIGDKFTLRTDKERTILILDFE